MGILDKDRKTIREAAARVIGRASDARGLGPEDISPRLEAAVAKNLFRGDAGPVTPSDIHRFIDEVRADDLCLVLACENGDERAWEDLVRDFDPVVKSAARKFAADGQDADDLASSLWAELYGLRTDADGNRKSKLGYYSGRGSLAGWLRAVVSQLGVDRYRAESRMVQVEEESDLESLANNGTGEISHRIDDPEELLTHDEADRDLSLALKDAIGELEPEDRLVIKLYYFDDLKLKEIASIFGYHEATASRRVVRIQNDIRKSVEKRLQREHGWSESEVKRYLSETASKLGITLEKLFVMLILVQAAAV